MNTPKYPVPKDHPYIKVIGEFDALTVVGELQHMIDDEQQCQPLQYAEHTSDNSCGYVTESKYPESAFVNFMHDMPYVNSMITEYGMFRTRVMNMKAQSSYTLHRDPTPRIHFVVAHDNHVASSVVIGDRIYQLDVGKVYWIDTRQWHSAVNFSTDNRIHIVGCCET